MLVTCGKLWGELSEIFFCGIRRILLVLDWGSDLDGGWWMDAFPWARLRVDLFSYALVRQAGQLSGVYGAGGGVAVGAAGGADDCGGVVHCDGCECSGVGGPVGLAACLFGGQARLAGRVSAACSAPSSTVYIAVCGDRVKIVLQPASDSCMIAVRTTHKSGPPGGLKLRADRDQQERNSRGSGNTLPGRLGAHRRGDAGRDAGVGRSGRRGTAGG